MIQGKLYVRQCVDGTWRVGDSDISIDSVVVAYQQGHSPESIQQFYPALTLEDVYGAITYYLGNQTDVHEYLLRQDARWEEVRKKIDATPNPVVARLRAIAHARHSTSP
jgi:uncharacterized protein (DUF433 family)